MVNSPILSSSIFGSLRFPRILTLVPAALQISALSEEQLRGLEEAFEMFDTKHEGTHFDPDH